jgi:enamine deaminase RidA (YjgF/YER057c/UK114 family)
MNKILNPAKVAAPRGPYSHGVEVPANARWLHISGQVGTAPDGSVPQDVTGQVENCWRNIGAILAEAGMGFADLVKVSAFLTSADDIAAYREARERIVGDHRPASTLVVVTRLVHPEWLVEVEAVAAKA